ncbi:dopamine receptor 2-like isoform X1 [Dendronephthya gigantea]|uniref:dopamine receptor 2-like isoform X1 n=2 Tax=Dendronephthya gigantea TaxID=151771 RepID=UPI00106A9E0B|nr:dopamine receptor 2-like isoform X1 [Dendronephthya gigantea]
MSFSRPYKEIMENLFNTSTTTAITSTAFRSDRRTTIDEDALHLSVTIVLSVFIFVSVIGNSLVCFVFYKQMGLRRVVYYPIISLAVADLLCGALAMPAYIAKKHVRGGWWEGLTCDVFRFTYFFTEYASVLSLMAISLERFIAVSKPVTHRMWLSKKKMIAFLTISWLDAAVVAALPFFWQKGTEDEPCVYDPTREWSLMVITTNVFAPFLVMLFCHVYTVSYALRFSRNRKSELLEKGNNPTSSQYEWQPAVEMKDKNTQKRERDITRTLGLVVGAFVICWGPSTFYYFLRMVCPHCFQPSFKNIKPIFNAVVKLMTFLNSCVNPLIYYWLNRLLRNAFYESLLGKERMRKRNAERVSAMLRENSPVNSSSHKNRSSWNTKKRLLDTNDSDERTSKTQTLV